MEINIIQKYEGLFPAYLKPSINDEIVINSCPVLVCSYSLYSLCYQSNEVQITYNPNLNKRKEQRRKISGNVIKLFIANKRNLW